MKTLLIPFLALLTAPPALAAEKLCTGTHGEFRGYEIKIAATSGMLVVSSMHSNRGYIAFAGNYAANKRRRFSPDGGLQLGFDGYEEGGFNEFFLDARLLLPGSTGSLEVKNINEGELEARFACKDFR